MINFKLDKRSVLRTSMLALAIGAVNQVNAADVSITLPAGLACEFDLTVNIDFNDNRVYKEWVDENGLPVRMLSAGKGDDLEFINAETGASYPIAGNGSVTHTTINADGSSTNKATGHNVIVLFPTDQPPGPSTIQYVGQIVYTIDTNGVFTLQKQKGRTIDICAALSE